MTDRTEQSNALRRLRWWNVIANAHPSETDHLDAGCEPGLELGPDVDDRDVVWLVLFADVDWLDEVALARRADEWRALFGG